MYAIHNTTWQSSVAADSNVILPCRFESDSLGVAAKSDSDDTDSQAKDWVTLAGAFAQIICLCDVLLNAFVPTSYQRLRNT